MIILHACICDGKLILWGENASDFSTPPVKRRGRKPKNPPPKTHPFSLDDQTLFTVIEKELKELKRSQISKCLIWLPSSKDYPIPSDPVLGDLSMETGKTTLDSWVLYGLELQETQVIPFLKKCLDHSMLHDGVRAGDDLLYLGRVMQFAISLTCRQRSLPLFHLTQ